MSCELSAFIDLQAFKDNLALVRRCCPTSQIMAVLKANAYGHGVIPIAKAIEPLSAVHALAVARLSEALEIRTAGITSSIVVLSDLLNTDELEICAHHELQPVIHTEQSILALTNATLKSPLKCWLKLDTGMHRLGFDAAQIQSQLNKINQLANIHCVGVMSHLATAEEPDDTFYHTQLKSFTQETSGITLDKSLANSAALLRYPNAHFDWVRPGIMLYGSNPLPTNTPLCTQLKPVMRLISKILAIREIGPNQAVGYNRRWYSQRVSRIATVGIGYADGYPRHAKNGTPVVIRGKRAPLIGCVSMDMITVDVTDIPQATIDDPVTLWGDSLLTANEVAACADTIAYDLFTGLGNRVRYQYHDISEPVK